MFEGQEIKYPVTWTFRVIVEATIDPTNEIVAIMKKNGFNVRPKLGNVSSGGKYRTWKVEAKFGSKLAMDSCATSLREVTGLKYLM